MQQLQNIFNTTLNFIINPKLPAMLLNYKMCNFMSALCELSLLPDDMQKPYIERTTRNIRAVRDFAKLYAPELDFSEHDR